MLKKYDKYSMSLERDFLAKYQNLILACHVAVALKLLKPYICNFVLVVIMKAKNLKQTSKNLNWSS